MNKRISEWTDEGPGLLKMMAKSGKRKYLWGDSSRESGGPAMPGEAGEGSRSGTRVVLVCRSECGRYLVGSRFCSYWNSCSFWIQTRLWVQHNPNAVLLPRPPPRGSRDALSTVTAFHTALFLIKGLTSEQMQYGDDPRSWDSLVLPCSPPS